MELGVQVREQEDLRKLLRGNIVREVKEQEILKENRRNMENKMSNIEDIAAPEGKNRKITNISNEMMFDNFL